MWLQLGGASTSRLDAVGSYGASALPKIATKTERPSTAMPNRPRQVPSSTRRAAPVDRGASLVDVDRSLIVDCTRGSRTKYRQSAIRLARITPTEKTRNVPCRTGKSLSLIALKVSSPRPGQEKIVSIVIAPPTTAPNWIAESVTSGSSAFGTACLRTTRSHGSPVARLTVTKSSVRTSTIDERMIRKYWPSSISVIAVAGRTRWSATSTAWAHQLENSTPGVICWPAGKIGIADREDAGSG